MRNLKPSVLVVLGLFIGAMLMTGYNMAAAAYRTSLDVAYNDGFIAGAEDGHKVASAYFGGDR